MGIEFQITCKILGFELLKFKFRLPHQHGYLMLVGHRTLAFFWAGKHGFQSAFIHFLFLIYHPEIKRGVLETSRFSQLQHFHLYHWGFPSDRHWMFLMFDNISQCTNIYKR